MPNADTLGRRIEAATEGPWFIRARPTDSGLAVIEDGRQHGLFAIEAEWHDAALIVALRNKAEALLACVRAAKAVIEGRSSTFRARNGRDVGIQDDSGEMCWIISHEDMAALEGALAVLEAGE